MNGGQKIFLMYLDKSRKTKLFALIYGAELYGTVSLLCRLPFIDLALIG